MPLMAPELGAVVGDQFVGAEADLDATLRQARNGAMPLPRRKLQEAGLWRQWRPVSARMRMSSSSTQMAWIAAV